jgi:hypothetical protein
MTTIKLDGGFALITGVSNYSFMPPYRITRTLQVASDIRKETAFSFAESGVAGVVFADIDEAKAIEAMEESKRLAILTGYRALAVKVE